MQFIIEKNTSTAAMPPVPHAGLHRRTVMPRSARHRRPPACRRRHAHLRDARSTRISTPAHARRGGGETLAIRAREACTAAVTSADVVALDEPLGNARRVAVRRGATRSPRAASAPWRVEESSGPPRRRRCSWPRHSSGPAAQYPRRSRSVRRRSQRRSAKCSTPSIGSTSGPAGDYDYAGIPGSSMPTAAPVRLAERQGVAEDNCKLRRSGWHSTALRRRPEVRSGLRSARATLVTLSTTSGIQPARRWSQGLAAESWPMTADQPRPTTETHFDRCWSSANWRSARQ